MTDTLRTALAFAHRGHAVFPINWPVSQNGRLVCSCMRHTRGQPCHTPAKHPYGRLAPNGLLSATTEPNTIREWFGVEAPQANLGVVTDKLIVLDGDPRHGGDDTLAALQREHDFPHTWRTLTGGGGEHVIFSCPQDVEVASSNASNNPVLGPGIDIRAKGGYIVAPPSRHISGRAYAWSVDHHPADTPLAEPPAWLIERLAPSSPATSEATTPEAWQRLTKPGPEYPDAAAAAVAGHLFRRWVDPYLVAGLLHAWNQTYCSPPLEDAEIRRILNRIARLEDRRREAQQQGGQHA